MSFLSVALFSKKCNRCISQWENFVVSIISSYLPLLSRGVVSLQGVGLGYHVRSVLQSADWRPLFGGKHVVPGNFLIWPTIVWGWFLIIDEWSYSVADLICYCNAPLSIWMCILFLCYFANEFLLLYFSHYNYFMLKFLQQFSLYMNMYVRIRSFFYSLKTQGWKGFQRKGAYFN